MPQRLYLMRHGERPESAGKNFVDLSFGPEGNYTPSDINHPRNIPKRADGFKCFGRDPPLTEIGAFSASLVGRAYKEKGVKIDRVYSSPSLRCVQTAAKFIEGYAENLPLAIETGIFEYMTLGAYIKGHPSWMTIGELNKAGYPVKETEQIIKPEELKYGESYSELYERSHRMIKALIERHPGESILCVGHGITLECCTRLLVGMKPRSDKHRLHVLLHSEYCSNIEVVEREDGTYEITGCPVNPLSISPVQPFDYRVYLMEEKQLDEDIKKKEELYKRYKSFAQ